jgi:hypothetical protein
MTDRGRARRFAAWMALASTLVGCGGTDEERFAQAFSGALCDQLARCAKGDYQADYFGRKDCVYSQERVLLGVADERAEAGCSFDLDEGLEAARDLRDLECGTFYEQAYLQGSFEALSGVWTGCGGGS